MPADRPAESPPGRPPAAEYASRRDAAAARAASAERLERRLANARLLVVVATGVAWWALRGRLPAAALVLPPALVFAALLWAHGRARRTLRRARMAVDDYTRGLARLEHRFAGEGHAGSEWLEARHPYAAHLDLFGRGSLYELLCGARTAAGRETLASWLLEPADSDEVAARQEAVRELAPRLGLREELASLDTEAVAALGSAALAAWGTAPSALPLDGRRTLAGVLAAATAGAALLAPWIGTAPLAWLLLGELALWWTLRRRVAAALASVERAGPALRLAHGALTRLQAERFRAPRLASIGAMLGSGETSAAHALGRLLRRLDALEWRGNQLFLPLATMLLWGTNCAFAIERWRREHGAEIEAWIAGIGELEALVDLGRFAYERPEYPMPSMAPGPARFHAEGLAHPLLARCTPNDVSLDEAHPLLIVTGSNMSGKSTLLRTVGVNAVLAQLGAPVRAASLSLTPLTIGASIRTVDSLLDGASRFYAEIGAIKRAVDAAEARPPGLFVLDELLHGTNSHDRRIGADAIVRAFLARGALGIVTTHDLALAEIADALGERASNAHFEFDLVGEEIRFDYRLRPGVVRTGNALAIMRAAGLEV